MDSEISQTTKTLQDTYIVPRNLQSLFFNKRIERYPQIRESILKYLNTKDIISTLKATCYRIRDDEFGRCINYSCFYKGIAIRSSVSPSWLGRTGRQSLLLNTVVYSRDELECEAAGGVQQWINLVESLTSPSMSIFDIKAENSEFLFHLVISVSITRTLGTLWRNCEVVSKRKPYYVWDDLNLPQDFTSASIPLTVSEIGATCEFVDNFCSEIVRPVDEFRKHFIHHMSMSDLHDPHYIDI